MRGYDRDKYGSSLRLGPQVGQTQQAKPPTWIPLQSSDPNSYAPQTQAPTPVGYGRNEEPLSNAVQGIVGSPTPTGYRPDSIAGMLQGGSSNDAIRDMILRKMIYGG